MGIYVGPPAALHGQVCLLQLMSCLGHGEEECYSLCVYMSMCVSGLVVLETTKHNRISQAESF